MLQTFHFEGKPAAACCDIIIISILIEDPSNMQSQGF